MVLIRIARERISRPKNQLREASNTLLRLEDIDIIKGDVLDRVIITTTHRADRQAVTTRADTSTEVDVLYHD